MAGYAVECKLKAVAMEIHDCRNLRELAERWQVDDRQVLTHGLEAFARRLPIWNRFTQSGDVWRDFVTQVNRWRPEWRYDYRDPPTDQAVAFVKAVRRVVAWLGNNA